MTTTNIYRAAFYLTGKGNSLKDIEVLGSTVYYHIQGPSIACMKRRYNSKCTKVNYIPFVSWCEKLKELTEKELSMTGGCL